jgi:hypothetical protein
MRSSTFIDVRIDAAMQVTDVSDIGELLSRVLKIGRVTVRPSLAHYDDRWRNLFYIYPSINSLSVAPTEG